MKSECLIPADDDGVLIRKIGIFLSKKNIDAVTGIRRMGRDNLVELTRSIAESEGIGCSVYPDTSGKDLIIFPYWIGIEGPAEMILSSEPDKDIVFGQDLCHQVPAIVRYRK